jgi:ABC-type multidrug transport system ATPase subunit
MIIELKNIGKKFNKDWIFRNINTEFKVGNAYAITGANGSGKSTLLQIISGFVLPSEGVLEIRNWELEIGEQETTKPQTVNDDKLQTTNNCSIAAPYLELIEEMTAMEFLKFHQQFKPFINNVSLHQILEEVQLAKAADKQIRYFSSGMKQRLKLAQAFFSDSTILLLDEPTTNLDKQGVKLYLDLIKQYTDNRLVIICSNDENEYSFCQHKLEMGNTTPRKTTLF